MSAPGALLQHLPVSLGRGVSLHGCFRKVQPLLLTLDEGYKLLQMYAFSQKEEEKKEVRMGFGAGNRRRLV